jgi:hydrogenase maturation protein HypF
MRERTKVRIEGRVQGVFFRETVRRIASHYEVHGFVRNVGEGVVEIEAEGEPEVVKAFISDVLENPPPLARIDKVHSSTISVVGDDGFFVAPTLR